MADDREFVEEYTRQTLAKRAYKKISKTLSGMEDSHQLDVKIAVIATVILAVIALTVITVALTDEPDHQPETVKL